MNLKRCSASIHTRATADIPIVDQAARDRMLALPPTLDIHRELITQIEALQLVETGGEATVAKQGPLRVAYWNAQRFHHFDACCDRIRKAAPDVVMLGEIDIGMARTGQRHCLRDAAAALGASYVFGAEFLELGLGDAEERRRYAGYSNIVGLHGNGILSHLALENSALIRLETDGDWFDGRHGERRIGGRCAVAASVAADAMKVLFVSVHLESHSGPELRAEQMRRLFDAIDRIAPAIPVVIGGDLNTSTLTRVTTEQTFDLAEILRDDPDRLIRPERYEPLFELARSQGYTWTEANAPGPTERAAEGANRLGHIDWFLVRGVHAIAPAIMEAVDGEGAMISDHEMITVTIAA